MITWAIIGSAFAVLGVVMLLYGAVRGDQANTREHQELGEQIGAVDTDVKALRAETAAGFDKLSEQITNLNPGTAAPEPADADN